MIKFFEKHSKISWLIAILTASAIFYLSSLTFPPGPYTANTNTIIYHFFAFFFFSFFLITALIKGKNKKFIFLAILIAIFYALSDEFHQLFVPGRCCSFSDFLVDSAGILIASFLYTLSLRLRKKENTDILSEYSYY